MYGDPNTRFWSFLREWLTGGLFPLSAMFALILLIFMAENLAVYGKNWTRRPGVLAACIFFWWIGLHAIRTGTAWLVLKAQNDDGFVPQWVTHLSGVAFAVTGAGLIAITLKGIYHFTPARWGHRYWIVSVLITVAFLIFARSIPNI